MDNASMRGARGSDPDLTRRRLGARARTSFAAAAYDGRMVVHCRVVELSTTGLVLERGRPLNDEDSQALLRLQLFLPGRAAPIRALARPVRQFSTRQALKFVAISDVDRLTLSEHLDRVAVRGPLH
jgi:hypothetical protein